MKRGKFLGVLLALVVSLSAHAATQKLSEGFLCQSAAKVPVGGDALSTPAADITGWYAASVCLSRTAEC